jgi:hypothetical protein
MARRSERDSAELVYKFIWVGLGVAFLLWIQILISWIQITQIFNTNGTQWIDFDLSQTLRPLPVVASITKYDILHVYAFHFVPTRHVTTKWRPEVLGDILYYFSPPWKNVLNSNSQLALLKNVADSFEIYSEYRKTTCSQNPWVCRMYCTRGGVVTIPQCIASH